MSFIESMRSMMGEELFNAIQASADLNGVPFSVAGYAIVRFHDDLVNGMPESEAAEIAFAYIDKWRKNLASREDKLIDCEVES